MTLDRSLLVVQPYPQRHLHERVDTLSSRGNRTSTSAREPNTWLLTAARGPGLHQGAHPCSHYAFEPAGINSPETYLENNLMNP
jgi:hypothetical protein